MTKKCTKKCNACEEPLHCSLKLLFNGIIATLNTIERNLCFFVLLYYILSLAFLQQAQSKLLCHITLKDGNDMYKDVYRTR